MATPLDIGLLGDFGVVFPAIFIFVVVYAFLMKTKIFENQAWNAALAIVVALMAILSPIATKTINRMAPYMVLLVILILFIMLAFMAFGVKEDSITSVVKTEAYPVKMILLLTVVGIFVGSLFSVISEETGFQQLTDAQAAADGTGDTSAPSEQQEFFRVLFHPKMLGMGAIMLIMIFTVTRLAAATEKSW